MNACPYCHRPGCSPACPGPDLADLEVCPHCGTMADNTRLELHACTPLTR